jgi:hypothetical protein
VVVVRALTGDGGDPVQDGGQEARGADERDDERRRDDAALQLPHRDLQARRQREVGKQANPGAGSTATRPTHANVGAATNLSRMNAIYHIHACMRACMHCQRCLMCDLCEEE